MFSAWKTSSNRQQDMSEGHGLDLYRAIGGTPGCRALSTAFYARVKQDPLLRPLFPGKTMTCAIEEFAAFLVQFLGGPSEDAQRRWWVSLRESHQRFRIGQRERAAWLGHMVKALEEVPIEVRGALGAFFEHSSAYVVNRETPQDGLHPEIASRWKAQRKLDDAVAAVRAGDADRAIALAGDSLPLLSVMLASGQSRLLDYVRERVTGDPSLIRGRFAGRTLLHVAAAQGNLSMVEFLLRLGADPNAMDGGRHTPLYSAGNECQTPGGPDVVRALVRAGAAVDANDGVKHCTALHMAARRGNVEIAVALLDLGADIDARDSLGVTPLRRALNCKKPGVVSLLLSRGAKTA
jgi:hemoglobin